MEEKRPLVERHQLASCRGGRGGAPVGGVDQRQLAEDPARPDLLERQAFRLDRHRPLADDEHASALVAGREDHVARREALDLVDGPEDLDRGGVTHDARDYAESPRGRQR